jgi:hypothetical protein
MAWIALALIGITVIAYFALSRRSPKEETSAVPAAADAGGAVKFLMEQQWRIRMKLALVEEKTVARQITATARVIPAAN